MLAICWLTHIISCIWYHIGADVDRSDTGMTWLFAGEDSHLEVGSFYTYCTALHWALTQMAGSMEINPRSSRERLFAVGVLFLGLLVCTSLISTITAVVTQYRMGLEASHKNIVMLDR